MKRLVMTFPMGKLKAFTMSYDDGTIHDVKLVGIMNKYGLKGTFNLNSNEFLPEDEIHKTTDINRRLTKSEAMSLYDKTMHEIAIHAFTHPDLSEMSKSRAAFEILEDKRNLENIFGYTIRGMAYPFGRTNKEIKKILESIGIVYARGVKYNGLFDLPEEWLEFASTTRNTDPKLFECLDRFLLPDGIYAKPKLFYMWGHSWEFSRDNNWDMLERFAAKISGRDDIWYATNIEIFDYITAYRNLRFNVDMTFVENPTATDVYFLWNGKCCCVKKGERINI